MSVPIVTIATQRSGTKFLGTCFNSGTVVKSFGEVFHPQTKPPSFWPFCAMEGVRWCPTEKEIDEVLDRFFRWLSELAEDRMVHVDVMYNNLGMMSPAWSYPVANPIPSHLLHYFIRRGVKIIHLVRADVAACFMSAMIAASRNQFHIHSGDEASCAREEEPYQLSVRDLIRKIVPILKTREFIRAALKKRSHSIEILYDDLAAASGDTVSKTASRAVAGLLGAGDRGLFGRTEMKRTSPDKKSVVTNHDELVEVAEEVARLVNADWL